MARARMSLTRCLLLLQVICSSGMRTITVKNVTQAVKNVTHASQVVADAVPKVIHFMYKEDPRGHWPNPIWEGSYKGWTTYFPEGEYEHKFWTDKSLATYFKEHCPKYYKTFQSYSNEVSRSDIARYCILKEQGGIYSDLDYEPRTNFMADLLPGMVSIVESPYTGEEFQNALMASAVTPKTREFWEGILEDAQKRATMSNDPTTISGPRVLDDYVSGQIKHPAHHLPCHFYQRKIHHEWADADRHLKSGCEFLDAKNLASVKGIHWGTWSWFKIGDGKNQNGDTQALFNMAHQNHAQKK